ncbi:MAG: UDP-N-acetylmuramoyl-tripeptide--D-alanyl-D-alanine ligase [Lachnospiraceae bacterium]|nr:UDP-N-acetylmuramoyl-tripeptide--D-alanyl-D-alanine ligase [Lachnospiraceae bacterium]
MPGLTVKSVCEACNGKLTGPQELYDEKLFSITADSRKASTGSAFLAIKGARVDGNSFIDEVYDKGAILCISENPPKSEDKPYIQVENIYVAIKQIAKYYLSQLDIKVIGITGSVGKTTTKEMVASVLSQRFNTLKTAGNFNNELGLPLTIYRLREEHEVAVLEMGISEFGEMDRLSDIDTPDACIITNVGHCHLENLKDRDGVLKAKTEIFNHMKDGGKIFLNGDDDKLATVTGPENLSKPVFFGCDKNNEIYAENLELMGLKGSKATIHTPKGDINVHIHVPGEHLIYAALAATTAGLSLGLTLEEIEKGISEFKTISGRNNIIDTGHMQIIDDCYNANPMSVKSGIDTLVSDINRRVAILGDMKELGTDEEKLHYETGEYVASKNVNQLITVGPLAAKLHEGCVSAGGVNSVHFDTIEECIENLPKYVKQGDTVLVKASHSMGFSKIVDVLEEM